MNHETIIEPNLDLVFERTTTIPVEKLWKGWTHPETLLKWFCPKPWKVVECRIDLRPVSRQIKPLLKVLIFARHQYEFAASAVNSKFSW